MEPFFIEGRTGNLFALYHAPSKGGVAHGGILIAPPFAEELNRSRHMMAAAARALASHGFAVLMIDLHGTGDSAGRFDDASWDGWCDDLETAADHLERQGHPLIGVLALRTGALLALDWIRKTGRTPETLALWGPAMNGATFINQFLRLRVAESMAREDGTRESTKDLKARLDQGETLEIGGYGLTSVLCHGIEGMNATNMPPPPETTVQWLDLSPSPGAQITPAGAKVIDAWADAGVRTHHQMIEGPAFWTLLEPEHVPALISATVDVFAREDRE